MKSFVKKSIFYAVFCLMLTIIPSVVIDPYNVFHWKHIRNNGVEPNQNYIKTKYIINNPEKYDGFIFGSSRVGSIHVEKINDGSFYNMTYSSGTPRENVETLKTFLNEGVTVKTVVLGVDSQSYTEDPNTHYTQGLRSPYQYLIDNKDAFANLYFNPTLAFQSLFTILDEGEIAGFDTFYEYGWWCEYDRDTTIDWDKAGPSIGSENLMDETLEDIKEIRDICESNGIEFILFINPMHEMTYRVSVDEHDFRSFLKKLVEISPYYNFSGINSITTNNSNFIDTSHYNAHVGDIIIDVIFNKKVNVKSFALDS